ncbi:acidobacterial duplicated orphan permease [Luteitalea pratensis]|uniref:Acidobacterial duplicated orphan permease n=1 Tax=Luteitalea pratensis TaxID=1855912 RepID=A0A143PSF8_LUTPR|nr:hypothetical protein [Luteitalea pratensis]AMY11321.1 acidobacterial duplicated orphan permease [Luteitalea pratensis]
MQARRELGPIDPILEACRDQRWWRGLDDLARDVRYALRTLGHAPIFALVAILTLTLGIGANAALFQVYEALMLRALPVQDAERLLMGVAVSVPLARWVEGLLYGVTVRDLGTYAVAGVTLAVVGVAAAWVPAWRASRMNPTSALRST